ncbi:hypothetical protein CBL_09184 [Carabus blaptoides fortunei]
MEQEAAASRVEHLLKRYNTFLFYTTPVPTVYPLQMFSTNNCIAVYVFKLLSKFHKSTTCKLQVIIDRTHMWMQIERHCAPGKLKQWKYIRLAEFRCFSNPHGNTLRDKLGISISSPGDTKFEITINMEVMLNRNLGSSALGTTSYEALAAGCFPRVRPHAKEPSVTSP